MDERHDTAPRAAVLVIDDERSVCLTCRRILEMEGYAVDTEQSGVAGVRRAIEGDYDLVLLDLKMPDLSGMEALEQIKGVRPDLTVIIITGYATIPTSVEAIKRGAFHYVPKPFTPEELSLAVEKALEDRRVRAENAFLREELARLTPGSTILGRPPPRAPGSSRRPRGARSSSTSWPASRWRCRAS